MVEEMTDEQIIGLYGMGGVTRLSLMALAAQSKFGSDRVSRLCDIDPKARMAILAECLGAARELKE